MSFQKLHGNRYKCNCLHSRKSKSQKRKRRDCPSSLSLTDYKPHYTNKQAGWWFPSNTLGTSIESQKSPEREQESSLPGSEVILPGIRSQIATRAQESPPSSHNPMSHTNTSRGTHADLLAAALSPQHQQLLPSRQATIHLQPYCPQMGPEPIPTPDVVTYPPLFDPQPSRHNTSPPYTPALMVSMNWHLFQVALFTLYSLALGCKLVEAIFLILSTSLGWYS